MFMNCMSNIYVFFHRFVIKLSQISHFKEKAQLSLHQSQFRERLASVQENISIVHDASQVSRTIVHDIYIRFLSTLSYSIIYNNKFL